MSEEVSTALRRIRSFVRRQGRITPRQQKALDTQWSRYGIDCGSVTAPLSLTDCFGDDAPVTLEIGFGMGDSLITMAANHPERRFIGVEVHRPGMGHALAEAAALDLSNIRFICDDAVHVLTDIIADHSLDTVQIFFPDPWHKKRHHKRRLVQTAFLTLLAQKLKQGGRLHLATDWAHYAEHMLEICEAHPEFVDTVAPGEYHPRPEWRPLTKFEQRGHRLGHGVWDLIYQRK